MKAWVGIYAVAALVVVAIMFGTYWLLTMPMGPQPEREDERLTVVSENSGNIKIVEDSKTGCQFILTSTRAIALIPGTCQGGQR